MKKEAILCGIILIIALAAFLLVHVTGNALSSLEKSCIETDLGPYEKMPGEVTFETIFGTTKKLVDTCNKERGTAREHTCSGKRASSKTVICDNGCNEAGTACLGTEWKITDAETNDKTTNEISFHEAFYEVEPGDELVFLTALEDEEAEAKPFIVEVAPEQTRSSKEKIASLEHCKFFVYKGPKIEKSSDILSEQTQMPEPNKTLLLSNQELKMQDNVWDADEGCFYKTTLRLEKPDSFTLGNVLDEKTRLFGRAYARYCTGQIGDVSMHITACKIEEQKGWDEVPQGIGALLKVTISLDGKKKK